MDRLGKERLQCKGKVTRKLKKQEREVTGLVGPDTERIRLGKGEPVRGAP